jgi:hypothetical protein
LESNGIAVILGMD